MGDDGRDEELAQHRAERRAAFEALAAAQQRAEQADAAVARGLVADFVRRAREQGIEPVPLRARGYNGKGTFRTPLTGWYLQPSGPLGVSVQGDFYILTVGTSLTSRWRGVSPDPSDPPLAVGRGARDGESMPLKELFDRRLAAGPDFPNRR